MRSPNGSIVNMSDFSDDNSVELKPVDWNWWKAPEVLQFILHKNDTRAASIGLGPWGHLSMRQ